VDAFVAWAVGTVVSAAVLLLLGLLGRESTLREAIGMVSLQAVPASIGALLAQSQLGGRPDAGDASDAGDGGPSSYGAELFLMLAGALFLALNIAPTEEMIVIAYRATPWHALALVVVSLGLMHAFVYAVEFRGQHARAADETHAELFVRFTVAGYAIALLASAYVLWTFGRLDDTSWGERVTTTLVLGFPAAIGAAAARLLQ
jgi:putative integral membrane protein (TIGR02587 family)